jgi:hypothetical protein
MTSVRRTFYLGVDGRTFGRLFSTVEDARNAACQYHTRSDGTPTHKPPPTLHVGELFGELYERWDPVARAWVDAHTRKPSTTCMCGAINPQTHDIGDGLQRCVNCGCH